MSQPQLHRTVSDNITVRYGNTVRNFPTHGQLSEQPKETLLIVSQLWHPFNMTF
jgi:hypothetical protein